MSGQYTIINNEADIIGYIIFSIENKSSKDTIIEYLKNIFSRMRPEEINNILNGICEEGCTQDDKDIEENLFLIAIEFSHSDSMNCLALLYKKLGKVDNMLLYFKMAIKNNNVYAMKNLGDYYMGKNYFYAFYYYAMSFCYGNDHIIKKVENFFYISMIVVLIYYFLNFLSSSSSVQRTQTHL